MSRRLLPSIRTADPPTYLRHVEADGSQEDITLMAEMTVRRKLWKSVGIELPDLTENLPRNHHFVAKPCRPHTSSCFLLLSSAGRYNLLLQR